MTYRAMDEDDNTATLEFTITITVETATAVRTIVAAVGDANGRPRFMDLPEPDDGPAVLVRGNPIIGGEPFGYYEIDLEDSAAPHRLTGQLPFDLDPALASFCLQVTAVDDSGAAGPPACHQLDTEPVGDGDVGTVGTDHAQARGVCNDSPRNDRSRRATGSHSSISPSPVEIPATARSVVTDGSTTAVVWVADREWWTRCGSAEKCVTQAMADAAAEQFLRPGASDDIYDWVAAIFGATPLKREGNR